MLELLQRLPTKSFYRSISNKLVMVEEFLSKMRRKRRFFINNRMEKQAHFPLFLNLDFGLSLSSHHAMTSNWRFNGFITIVVHTNRLIQFFGQRKESTYQEQKGYQSNDIYRTVFISFRYRILLILSSYTSTFYGFLQVHFYHFATSSFANAFLHHFYVRTVMDEDEKPKEWGVICAAKDCTVRKAKKEDGGITFPYYQSPKSYSIFPLLR